MGRCPHRPVLIYMFCFLIPKIILKIPLKNFGLFTNITFINIPPIIYYQQRQQEIPSIITQIASIATKNLGGQKQLISKPKAKTIPIRPLFVLLHFLRIFIPPILHNKQNLKLCYKYKNKRPVLQ